MCDDSRNDSSTSRKGSRTLSTVADKYTDSHPQPDIDCDTHIFAGGNRNAHTDPNRSLSTDSGCDENFDCVQLACKFSDRDGDEPGHTGDLREFHPFAYAYGHPQPDIDCDTHIFAGGNRNAHNDPNGSLSTDSGCDENFDCAQLACKFSDRNCDEPGHPGDLSEFHPFAYAHEHHRSDIDCDTHIFAGGNRNGHTDPNRSLSTD